MGNRTKLMADNFLDSDEISALTASSENATYPVENIQISHRGQAWRSSGWFNVTVFNNVFYIDDGASKAITLTVAEYTGATLATEIQTQLNASSTNFTVAYSSTTNKFTISRTTNFELNWTNVLTIAADLLGFNSLVDDTGADSYEADSSRICYPAEWLKFDLGTSQNPKAFILLDKAGKILNLSSTATITLQASASDSWNSPEEVVLTYNSASIVKIDMDGLFTTSYRYFRLYIEDLSNVLGHIEAGFVYLGDAYELESSNVQREFQETIEDLSNIQQAESGEQYADIKTQKSSFGEVMIQYCNKTDLDFLIAAFKEFGSHTPLIIAFDSETTVTSSTNEWTKLVKFTSSISKTIVKVGIWNVSFSMQEEI